MNTLDVPTASRQLAADPAGLGALTTNNETLYWVRHEKGVWLLAEFKGLGTDQTKNVYTTEFGDVFVPVADQQPLELTDQKVLEGVPDICELDQVTTATVLDTIRRRYQRGDIYTNISRILIAVNPFQGMDIYGPEYIEMYSQQTKSDTLPPHVFQVAADAFHGLREERKGQSVLISGESGAGKSETTKLVLLYVSEFLSNSDSGFVDQLLRITPVLEAFGNAKTVRNHNSSRFVKWIEVLADPSSMQLCSASVTEYLLEMPRVTSQGPGERNFHIFYQLCADTSGDWEHLKVLGAERFNYLKRNPALTDGVDDVTDFREVCRALTTLKFTRDEVDGTFRTAAAVLHLGNMEYQKDPRSEGVDVVDKDLLSDLAELMGVPMEPLLNCLVYKRLIVRNETTHSPLGVSEACTARDNISKLLYGRLFSWLVFRCNQTLKRTFDEDSDGFAPDESLAVDEDCDEDEKKQKILETAMRFIGVLDIAGFEKFETNMLEQLLINLSNEKLQQVFNQTVFKQELADYAEEGISDVDVAFIDNEQILKLLEGKVLPALDDATTGVKQTDATFTSKINKDLSVNPYFVTPKFGGLLEFGIKHYAGEVVYSTKGFLEKNQLSQPPEVLELLDISTNVVMQQLAPEQSDAMRGRKVTISSGFRKNLNSLIDKLNKSNAHFIRCIKPNSKKVPKDFDSPAVIEQMTCAGIEEAVKLRKLGYAFRQTFKAFIGRYLIILPKAERRKIATATGISLERSVATQQSHRQSATVIGLQGDNEKKAVSMLVDALPHSLSGQDCTVFAKTQCVIGKTKVFVKEALYQTLENNRNKAFVHPTVKIQACVRGWLVRKGVKEAKVLNVKFADLLSEIGVTENNPTTNLLKTTRRATLVEGAFERLVTLIDASVSCPLPVSQLEIAMRVRTRLQTEATMARQMQELQTSMDLPAIEALLERATKKQVANGTLFETLAVRKTSLQEQLQLRNALKSLTKKVPTPVEMEAVLKQAADKGLEESQKWIIPNGASLVHEVKEMLEQSKNKSSGKPKEANPEIMKKVASQAHRWIEAISKRKEREKKQEETKQKLAEDEAARRKDEEETEQKLQDLEWMRAAAWGDEEEEQINQKIKALRQHQMQMVLQEKEAEKEAQAAAKKEKLEAQMAHKKDVLVETIQAVIRKKEEIREAELKQVRENLETAYKCFDAPELQACFSLFLKLGVDISTYKDEHDRFLNLQNVEFVEERIKEIQDAGSKKTKPGQAVMYNLLALSNLDDQLKLLVGRSGFADEFGGSQNANTKRKIIANVSRANRATRRGKGRTSDEEKPEDAAEEEMVKDLLAEKLFKDVANYTYLRDPWNPGGRQASGNQKYHVSYEDAIAERLHHALILEYPITAIKDEFIVPCRRIFWNILRAMGDKATPYKWDDKHKPVIDAANRTEELREEVFMQMMKQLTGNPSMDSNIRGWKLLAELCKETLPSYELIEFVKAFCQRATDERFHPSAGLAPEGRQKQLAPEADAGAVGRTASRASNRGARRNPDKKYHKNGWGYINPNFDADVRRLANETLEVIEGTLSRLEKEWKDWGATATGEETWQEGWEETWQEGEEEAKEGQAEW